MDFLCHLHSAKLLTAVEPIGEQKSHDLSANTVSKLNN